MTQTIIGCAPETPLRSVASLMARHRVHAVYVFDDCELLGLVSDLDVVAAAVGGLEGRLAGDSAVVPIHTVMSDAPLREAAELMSLKSVTHVAVVDGASRRPVGVVSTLDIARVVAGADA